MSTSVFFLQMEDTALPKQNNTLPRPQSMSSHWKGGLCVWGTVVRKPLLVFGSKPLVLSRPQESPESWGDNPAAINQEVDGKHVSLPTSCQAPKGYWKLVCSVKLTVFQMSLPALGLLPTIKFPLKTRQWVLLEKTSSDFCYILLAVELTETGYPWGLRESKKINHENFIPVGGLHREILREQVNFFPVTTVWKVYRALAII